MQDLALLVAFILLVAFFAGPLAFIATKIPGKNFNLILLRRSLVILFSLFEFAFSFQLLIAGIPLMPKLLAIAGSAFAVAAITKEWKSFKRK